MKRHGRARSGFSLVETAVVLGVVGLVIGGIWVSASAVNESLRRDTTERAVLTMADSAVSYFRNTGAATDISSFLVYIGAVPSSMVSGTSIRNSWGGQLTASVWSDQNRVTFYLDQLPKAACVTLSQRMRVPFEQLGTLVTRVNDCVSYDTDDITQYCVAGSSNTLTWYYNYGPSTNAPTGDCSGGMTVGAGGAEPTDPGSTLPVEPPSGGEEM